MTDYPGVDECTVCGCRVTLELLHPDGPRYEWNGDFRCSDHVPRKRSPIFIAAIRRKQ